MNCLSNLGFMKKIPINAYVTKAQWLMPSLDIFYFFFIFYKIIFYFLYLPFFLQWPSMLILFQATQSFKPKDCPFTTEAEDKGRRGGTMSLVESSNKISKTRIRAYILVFTMLRMMAPNHIVLTPVKVLDPFCKVQLEKKTNSRY